MWLITQRGFYSIVQKPGDAELTVRARCKEDFEQIFEILRDIAPRPVIRETPDNDYPYRINLPHQLFAFVVGRMVMNIHYPNFKACAPIERYGIYSRVHRDLQALELEYRLNL
jgi:hypothetical protein